MDTGRRRPNERLAGLMAEAGFSNHGLAKRVRDIAQSHKSNSSADHVSVARWLNGAVPRGDTPLYIGQALESKLRRPISLREMGFADVAEVDERFDLARKGVRYPSDVTVSIGLLSALSRADLEASPVTESLTWTAADSANVLAPFVFGSPLGSAPTIGRPSVSPIARMIRDTADHLMELDLKVGGGNTRKLLLFYFHSEVVPALHGRYSEIERKEVLGAAAEVAQLLAWTAYDTGRHGVAQRYFVQAIRLAEEAADRLLGGRLLANMSHQATYLGNFDEAVYLARAAQTATSDAPVATVSSMFFAMEARALAGAGRSRESAQALHKAEQAFEKRRPDTDPKWIGYFDREELAGEAVHCFRDVNDASAARAYGSYAQSSHSPQRTQAFVGMVNASVALADHELEEAVQLASEAMALAGSVRSHRYLQYLADFRAAVVAKFPNDPKTSALLEHIDTDYPSLTTPHQGSVSR